MIGENYAQYYPEHDRTSCSDSDPCNAQAMGSHGCARCTALVMDIADRDRRDAARYRWLRSRDLDTISQGGVFAGRTPQNVVLNGDDLDAAIDAVIAAAQEPKL